MIELILILGVLLLLEKEIGTLSPTHIDEISGTVINAEFQAMTGRHSLVRENFCCSLKNCGLHLSLPGDAAFREFRFLQESQSSSPSPSPSVPPSSWAWDDLLLHLTPHLPAFCSPGIRS